MWTPFFQNDPKRVIYLEGYLAGVRRCKAGMRSGTKAHAEIVELEAGVVREISATRELIERGLATDEQKKE